MKSILALLCFTALNASAIDNNHQAASQLEQTHPTNQYPERVLITNDNGIDDPKIKALAKAFARHSETWVLAPYENQSGMGHRVSFDKMGHLVVEPRDLGPNITAFAVKGTPADSVVLALAGVMKEQLPDLVVSGINGGPNLGPDWLGSGTIGAARMASFAGIPAIAVSGLNNGQPEEMEKAVNWVVNFASSPLVQGIQPGQYVTVGLPRTNMENIKGVRMVDRNHLPQVPVFNNTSDSPNLWNITGAKDVITQQGELTDIIQYEQDYIVITPMLADEVDHQQLSRWQKYLPNGIQ